jgi:hypothetical protein
VDCDLPIKWILVDSRLGVENTSVFHIIPKRLDVHGSHMVGLKFGLVKKIVPISVNGLAFSALLVDEFSETMDELLIADY